MAKLGLLMFNHQFDFSCAMSKHLPENCITDHPAIIAIAMDVMFCPSHRAHYSELVLMLADAALERIKGALIDHDQTEKSYMRSEASRV